MDMMKPDLDLARLQSLFVAPLAVSDILSGKQALDEHTEYALQEILAGYEPDQALMAIALSAQILADHVLTPETRMLGAEASDIVATYGSLYLSNKDMPASEQVIYTRLCHIPEDLEAMAELTAACAGALEAHHPDAALLCAMLMQESFVQMQQAEHRLSKLNSDMPRQMQMMFAAATPTPDNVIPFPVREG